MMMLFLPFKRLDGTHTSHVLIPTASVGSEGGGWSEADAFGGHSVCVFRGLRVGGTQEGGWCAGGRIFII